MAPAAERVAEVSYPREGVAVVAPCGNHDLLDAQRLRALLARLISRDEALARNGSSADR